MSDDKRWSGVRARPSPRGYLVEVELRGGNASHFSWLDPERARTLAADLVAAADEQETNLADAVERHWARSRSG